jgi:hypothetical protein
MKRCFVVGHADPAQRPTAAEWENVLEAAEQELVRCSRGHLYANHLTVCPWCAGRIPVAPPQPRPGPASRTPARVEERRVPPPPIPPSRRPPPVAPAAGPYSSGAPPQPPGSSWTRYLGPVILGIFLLAWLMGQPNGNPPVPRPRATLARATTAPAAPRRATSVPTPRRTVTARPLAPIATEPYPIVGAAVSGNSAQPAKAWDGDTGTAWRDVLAGSRKVASLEIDLGATRPIGVIRWWLSLDGVTGTLRIRVFDADRRVVSVYVASAEEPAINRWQEVRLDERGRYVLFEFTHARADGVAGGLAEVAIYPPQPAAIGTPNPLAFR